MTGNSCGCHQVLRNAFEVPCVFIIFNKLLVSAMLEEYLGECCGLKLHFSASVAYSNIEPLPQVVILQCREEKFGL